MIRLWVDDERPMPRGFNMRVKKAGIALEVIKKLKVIEISLDHDLGGGPNGSWLVNEIEKLARKGTLSRIKLSCHSMNPVGRNNINASIQAIEQYWSEM